MRVIVAVDEPHGSDLAAALEIEGISVVAVMAADAPAALADSGVPSGRTRRTRDAGAAVPALDEADVLVLEIAREGISAAVVAMCDRLAIRIVPLASGPDQERLAATFGLETALPLGVPAWQLAERLTTPPVRAEAADPAVRSPRVIVVWGPAGSPGRSTLAIELAVELGRGGRRVALVDADSHAPSIALALGLADEAPGFAAACRQAERGALDARELARISAPLGSTGVEVLTGLNRPSRWPELSESRVAAALAICREWAEYTVVDVAASLERDEEIVSDLDGPRRNAATLSALRTADLVVAVAAADPLGISRFLRAYPELQATVGATPIAVLANRLRAGALGIDARGQVRRTLDRFGGIADVWFVPTDTRGADAALLGARPIAEASARSPIPSAVRRFVGEAVASAPDAGGGIRRSSRHRALRPVPA